MDEYYGNVKNGHHSNWIDEGVYENDIRHVVESDSTVHALSGRKVDTKRSCRAAALILGLLCLLLLAGLNKETGKPWNESREDCRQKDADLVIIDSDEEQEFVRRWKTRMWIGLTDGEKEGTWKWVDGRPLGSPSYWARSEPNDAKGVEDCVEIYNYDEQKSWNDAPCQNEKDWICERRAK